MRSIRIHPSSANHHSSRTSSSSSASSTSYSAAPSASTLPSPPFPSSSSSSFLAPTQNSHVHAVQFPSRRKPASFSPAAESSSLLAPTSRNAFGSPSNSSSTSGGSTKPLPFPTPASIAKAIPGKTRRITAATAATSVRRSPGASSAVATTATTATAKSTAAPLQTTCSSPVVPSPLRRSLVLRQRDHNVASLVSRKPPTRSAADVKMPPPPPPPPPAFDRPPGGVSASRQPQLPQLSATAAKALHRGGVPLTPKIAAGKTTSPVHHVVSPTAASRRPRVAPADNDSVAVFRDNVAASPAASFLTSKNITQRSGSRQGRVDNISANTTPTTTPNPERHHDWDTRSGLGISPTILESETLSRRPTVAFASLLPDAAASPARSQDGAAADAKFFYASDARKDAPSAGQPQQQQYQQQPRAGAAGSSFVYANGDSIEAKASLASPPVAALPPTLGSQDVAFSTKFVYANGAPNLQKPPLPPLKTTAGPASTVSTSSRMTAATSRNTTGAAARPHFASSQRPQSPTKPAVLQATMSRGSTASSAALLSRAATMTTTTAVPVVAEGLGAAARSVRRISIDATPKYKPRGHSRSASLSSDVLPPAPPARETPPRSPPSDASSSPPTSGASSLGPIVMASVLQQFEESAAARPDGGAYGELHSPTTTTTTNWLQSPTRSLHSPTKSSGQPANPPDQVNELVATARRERKVQDLEITNASLEAINRTLERQLRKQTAELRRYRRLSRSGRLSLPLTTSARVASGSTSASLALDGSEATGAGLSDLSEEEDDDSDTDEDLDSPEPSESSETDSASETATSEAREARDARRRERDERRLHLDLSKHRQLLVDSQKMNQSLRRCLNWTEMLIKDGRKALEYRVRVSDVELGGRVLQPHLDDDDDDYDGSLIGGEADDSAVLPDPEPTLRGWDGADSSSPANSDGLSPPAWAKTPQDRDSGIELPTDAT